MTDLLTLPQAAALRGVTRQTVWFWCKGGLRHQRLGRMVVVRRSDLDAYRPRRVGRPGKPAAAK